MANKRVIDLPDLSQEVQEGQYVLVDSAGGTGKMDLKHIVDEAVNFDPAGEYPELYAGNLTTDKAQTDRTPYLFRKTGGTLSRVGERCYDTIIGASVGENQLCNGESVTVPNGRKYYLKKSGAESLGASTGTAITGLTSGSDMVIDLTQMLGSTIADYAYTLEQATAGSGIAWLRSYGFLGGYKAYNAGSIESVEVTEKKCVGFNQWDEEWELGAISSTTGENVASSSKSRSKNFIPVFPSTPYYHRGAMAIDLYDADKNFIRQIGGFFNSTTFATPSNCHFIKFFVDSPTMPDDICINLSSDRNGEYEPYKSASYPLGSDVLWGLFKLDANNNLYADGDVKTSDGVIARKYGVVTLDGVTNGLKFNNTFGSTDNGYAVYWVAPVDKVFNANFARSDKFVCDTHNYPDMPLYTFVGSSGASTTWSFILPSSITSLDEANAWLQANNTTIVYPLATPTTEQGDPFPSPQIVYPDGTEEYVTNNGVPVGHSTEYPYDLKGLVEGLIDVPDVPSSNGTYVLKATRSASGVVYNWVTG